MAQLPALTDQNMVQQLNSLHELHGLEEGSRGEGNPHLIGKGMWGIPTLLAQYLAQEGSQGSWMGQLERTTCIALAIKLDRYLPSIIELTKGLIAKGYTSAPDQIALGASYFYARDISSLEPDDEILQPEALMLYMAVDNAPECTYCFRLYRAHRRDDFKWQYHARQITSQDYLTGNLKQPYFRYGDSRDPGYCGSSVDSVRRVITDGYAYVKPFTQAFDLLAIDIDSLIAELIELHQ